MATRREKKVSGLEHYAKLAEKNTARVIVSENFAALYRVKPGETIALTGPRGPIEVEVVGTAEDYSWNLGSVFMDRHFYRSHFDDDRADAFNVFVKDGADVAQVREDVLRRCGGEHGLVIFTRRRGPLARAGRHPAAL